MDENDEKFRDYLEKTGILVDVEKIRMNEIRRRNQEISEMLELIDKNSAMLLEHQEKQFLFTYRLFLERTKIELVKMKERYDVETSKALASSTVDSLRRGFQELLMESRLER